MRARTTIISGALIALLLVAPGALAQAGSLSGALDARERLALGGETNAALEDGVLHLRTPDLAGSEISLTADRVEINVRWQQGYRTVVDGDEVRYYTGFGNDTHTFLDAEINLGRLQPTPELLAIVGSHASATGSDDGLTLVDIVHDTDLTRVEWSEQSQSTGEDPPGFWYHVDGPWLRLNELQTAQVAGDFDLFVNNVTLAVDHREGSWDHWTGYKENNPERPVSRFESRVTVIHVLGGDLELSTPRGIDLLGREATAGVDGTITAERADGKLATESALYEFEDAPLYLDGQGQIKLRAGDQGGRAQGALQYDSPIPVHLQPTGTYSVRETQGVVTTETETPLESSSTWLWIAAVLVVILTGVATRFAGPIQQRIIEAKARRREQRVEAWMHNGDRLTSVRDYEGALGWYARVVSAYPSVTEAWYAMAVVLTELGRHAEAAEAYGKANEQLGGDDPELLDLAGLAAWRAGETEQARDAWEQLSVVDPVRLRERLRDPSLGELADEPWVRQLFETPKEASVSYA